MIVFVIFIRISIIIVVIINIIVIIILIIFVLEVWPIFPNVLSFVEYYIYLLLQKYVLSWIANDILLQGRELLCTHQLMLPRGLWAH